jgi:hypothetical protein
MTHEAWNVGKLPDGSRIVAGADTAALVPAASSIEERLKVQSGPFKGKPQQWFTRAEVLALLANHSGVPAGVECQAKAAELRCHWPACSCASGARGTYTPSREVVQQALELVDRIRDSHASWGGWSGLPATCERITYMLRYGKSPDGVKAPAATPPDCCPQCMGEGWVELKRLCKKHGSGVDSSRTTEPKGGA